MIDKSLFTHKCNGDICRGDTILFKETVWGGSFRHPTVLGERTNVAVIERDSYGSEKQQHTFTLRIIESEGTLPLKAGTITKRKGRNIYKNNPFRLEWIDEPARSIILEEKHKRGERARKARDSRRNQRGLDWSFEND